MEHYYATNEIDLLNIFQISQPESALESFHCVLMFNNKMLDHLISGPKKLASGVYLINISRELQSDVDQK